MRSWSSCNDPGPEEMKQGITQAIRSDLLDLTDLLEISDLLLRDQIFRLRVSSWSMYPVLWKGDQITVEPATPTQLQVGDLLLFHDHGRLICHRLVATQETGTGQRLTTKGDAAAGCGEVIQPDQVLGRVVAVTRRWPWAGSLSKRIDCWLARLWDEVAQGLLALQGLRSYRWTMRALLSRCLAYYVGIPEGRRWISYQPISRRGGDPIALNGRRDFYLLAKLGGTSVGSLQVKAVAQGYWIENMHVRIRYRGMGVGSQLLALAAAAASRNGAPVLLVSVEHTNTAALDLFTKMGFRKTGGLRGNEVSLRQDI
jgi:signal peptidase I